MLIEKTFAVTLKDATPVDVFFCVEKSEAIYDEDYETSTSYDVAGLTDDQIDEVEQFIVLNADAWLEDALAEFEEQQEGDCLESWDENEY